MMNALVMNGLYVGFDVGAQANVPVSHLQFVDDILLVGDKKLGRRKIFQGSLLLF